jgi:crossover junction endodeoxyribonuclease RuvC
VSEKIILGIDPGTSIMGYGVIKVENRKPTLLAMGIVDLQKLDDHFVKHKHKFEETNCLIEKNSPDELAIEEHYFGKNIQSIKKHGRAQCTDKEPA